MLLIKNPRAGSSTNYSTNIQTESDLLLISISSYKNRQEKQRHVRILKGEPRVTHAEVSVHINAKA